MSDYPDVRHGSATPSPRETSPDTSANATESQSSSYRSTTCSYLSNLFDPLHIEECKASEIRRPQTTRPKTSHHRRPHLHDSQNPTYDHLAISASSPANVTASPPPTNDADATDIKALIDETVLSKMDQAARYFNGVSLAALKHVGKSILGGCVGLRKHRWARILTGEVQGRWCVIIMLKATEARYVSAVVLSVEFSTFTYKRHICASATLSYGLSDNSSHALHHETRKQGLCSLSLDLLNLQPPALHAYRFR